MIHQRLHKTIALLAKRRILPKSKLGKAIHYALSQWPKLELFLADGRVEIDNNLVEPSHGASSFGDMRIWKSAGWKEVE